MGCPGGFLLHPLSLGRVWGALLVDLVGDSPILNKNPHRRGEMRFAWERATHVPIPNPSNEITHSAPKG